MAKQESFKPDLTGGSNGPNDDGSGWFAVQSGGRLKCSCGRPLVRISKKIWRCSYGYPQYSLDEGDWYLDKFGTMMFKEKGHDEPEGEKKKRKKKK